MRAVGYLFIACGLGLLVNCAHTNVAPVSVQGISSDAAVPKAGPSVEMVETSYDFGKIGKQEIVHHDFKIKNIGSAPLEIKSVESL